MISSLLIAIPALIALGLALELVIALLSRSDDDR